MTPEGKNCGQIYKEYWRNEVGQVKRCGVTPSRENDTRVKSIKCDSDEQKRSSVFHEKIISGDTAELAETVMTKKVAGFFSRKKYRGYVTRSVAAPGVTHPSDATALIFLLSRAINRLQITVNCEL